ncbi:DinG family ATP-dependent helicase YoaA [Rhodovastum atsumiense]|uniref:ATP-dependent DNA helicase n=1 Tax=Rhodovastum atsumiense TaxID=504468 RepID=A0A5M6IR48_9PROT|nr:ATP-dependent DNA helicase [Rhodovastum atsumiense]KAA5610763.1 ATP-dependent DNA helicase [Rhodovastum atsumiense]CAH2604425.1 DinG family ATP-dependent helicase YoaA [Rhodovastum atsumiense]
MTERAIHAAARPRLRLPAAPAVVAGTGRAAILTEDGEVLDLPAEEAAARLRKMAPPLLVHAPATLRRLGLRTLPALDLLELFAFVLPGHPAAPTPRGLALALDLKPPGPGLESAVSLLPDLTQALLARLAAGASLPLNRDAAALAARMGQAGWDWADFVIAAAGGPAVAGADPLRVWRRLPEWEEVAPPPPPASHPVSPADARARLGAMLGEGAEERPGQSDYAAAAAAAFAPREQRGDPHLVLAEAGTGTGKTLGYIAPASLWAERNQGPVWISTFTRHLQRQVEAELVRLHPDPAERRRRVVIRKGRENYLCLLNFEDAVNAALAGNAAVPVIPLGLIARWALTGTDGDIQGGDLPGWFAELFAGGLIPALADRRGECIHAACPHWRRCFVEHTIRRARGAELVVANHALVMAQAAWGGIDDTTVPLRYVFDEGHHLFDAADGAFAATLSGVEAGELRRWLLGAEGSRSRARGLRRRIEELVAERPELLAPLDAALQAARALPGPGWSSRLQDPALDPAPDLAGVEPGRQNPCEAFLRAARQQVLARAPGEGEPGRGSVECDLFPPAPGLAETAADLDRALGRLAAPLERIVERLAARLEDEAEELDAATRNRIEASCRSIRRRALDRLAAWQEMLRSLAADPPAPGIRPTQVMFLRLDRWDGRDADVGLHRHWLDPTIPFALSLAQPAQGLLVTSATLRDAGAGDPESAWAVAEARAGAVHLPSPAIRVAVASPFDYAAQTRAFVVTDVNARDIAALAAAYRALFQASGGGGLGLFTAISRLRAVHARIAPELEAAGIPLLAQHVDPMDNATLIDIFRTEEESCLLGTDAMRDGVDVPGRALRLVVFERVPWPRPDILHRERRVHLGAGDPTGYDDRIVRFRLRQAFGRLIRSTTDRGVFVLLDRQTPTRLLSAFPQGVAVRRLGLAQVVAETRDFLS